MISYAIGLPGKAPTYVGGMSLAEINARLKPSEVAISFTGETPPRSMINASGTALEPIPVMLEERKADLWTRAIAYRNTRQESVCPTPLGIVQIDANSQRKIAGAVQLAIIAKSAGQPFSIEWTMANNSTVAHDADAMIVMGVAVGTYIAECQEAGTTIREAIIAANDVETLNAIDITAGYPT